MAAINEPSSPAEEPVKKPVLARLWRTGRIVIKDPAGTGSLIALLIGIIMSASPSLGVQSVGVQSVGYAIVGAAAFSFIYQFWANDALVDLITSKVEGAQKKAYERVENQWQVLVSDANSAIARYADRFISMHKRHWPLETYPEGNVPNAEFNRRIEADLLRSVRYDFRGQSGKHLASRLIEARYPTLRIVRVVIEDATIPQVMNARMDEKRFGEPDFQHRTDDELRRLILDDMLDSLIGLYLAASWTRIDSVELVYASRPTDVRVEIIDGIVYISPFVRNRPQGYKYPEVFRYDPQSIPAQVAMLEFEREFGLLSETRVRFDSSTPRDTLREHLKLKGWELSAEELGLRCRAAERSLRVLNDVLENPHT